MAEKITASNIKLALWYIEKAGSKEKALDYLERAIESLQDDEDEKTEQVSDFPSSIKVVKPGDTPFLLIEHVDENRDLWFIKLRMEQVVQRG